MVINLLNIINNLRVEFSNVSFDTNIDYTIAILPKIIYNIFF